MVNRLAMVPGYILKTMEEIPAKNRHFPICRKQKAGILFTDVTKFTKLTEIVSDKGHYGVEIITEILNYYFEEMFAVIKQTDGSLLKYGGDSILAIFEGNKKSAVSRMQSCLKQMFNSLDKMNVLFKEKYGVTISFHFNTSYGSTETVIVGNPKYQLDYYIVGDAVKDVFDGGLIEKKYPISDETFASFKDEKDAIKNSIYFVPEQVAKKMESSDFRAELRNSAILFLSPADKSGKDIIDSGAFQAYYLKLQKIVSDLDGFINKIDFTEKGYLVLITFGIPNVHEDDIERAFICSQKILQISSKTIKSRIGVTYSNIYSGVLGAKERFEYGVIGNAVNIAARIMSLAKYGEADFSEEIISQISSRFAFELVQTTKVKGIREAINVYRISGELPDSWSLYESKYKNINFVGFSNLFSQNDVIQDTKPLLISGNSGVGKSILVYNLIKYYAEQSMEFDLISADEFSRKQPLNIVFNILKSYDELKDFRTNFNVLKNFCQNHNLKINNKLMEDYLFAGKDSYEKSELDAVFETLSDIIAVLFTKIKLLCIDNVQWIDIISSKIIKQTIPKLMMNGTKLILISRKTESFKALFDNEHTELRMENLNEKDSIELIQNELPKASMQVAELLVKITKGNPSFIHEMNKTIKRYFRLKKDVIRITDIKNMEREGKIPMNLENVFLGQYENFDNESKQFLKIASIFGTDFSESKFSLFQDKFKPEKLIKVISKLSDDGIIFRKELSSDSTYLFTNGLMRDTIYRTILKSEKKSLHNKIGQHLITEQSKNLNKYYEIITNHFIKAENKSKIYEYAVLSAVKTNSLSAFDDSLYYLQHAKANTNAANKLLPLQLREAELHLILGHVNETKTILDEIDLKQISEKKLQDQYHFIKVKTYGLIKDFDAMKNYIESECDNVTSQKYLFEIQLYDLDRLRMQSELDEFKIQADKLQVSLRESGNTKNLIKLLSVMGQFYINQGYYDSAKDAYSEMSEASTEVGAKLYKRMALHGIGNIYSRTGKLEKAMGFYTKARNLAESIGDKNGYGKALTDIATVLRRKNKFTQAIEIYNESLTIAKLIGDRMQEEVVTYQIGEAYFIMENYDEAVVYLEKAKTIAEQISDSVGISYACDALGDIYNFKENFDEAEKIYKQNLELQKKINDREGIGHTLGNLGNVANGRGDFDTAVSFYEQQINLLTEIGDKSSSGRGYFNWGYLEFQRKDFDESVKKFTQALELFQECGELNRIDTAKEWIENAKKEIKT